MPPRPGRGWSADEGGNSVDPAAALLDEPDSGTRHGTLWASEALEENWERRLLPCHPASLLPQPSRRGYNPPVNMRGNSMWKSFDFLWSGRRRDGAIWDTVLMETEHFVVVPTVGALVEGWLLVITKGRFLCMGELPQTHWPELQALTSDVTALLKNVYGSAVVFEHGPAATRQAIGCGVDHAHLHILPVEFDLIHSAERVQPCKLDWEDVPSVRESIRIYREGRPYLYIEQPLGRGRITYAEAAPSQFFRRVIAEHLGIPSKYDWRSYPMADNVEKTIHALSPHVNLGELILS